MRNEYYIIGDKAYVQLTQGRETIIDISDMNMIKRYRWCISQCGKRWYAKTNTKIQDKRVTLRMHRLIMGLSKGDKIEVDHIDGDGLNNRRINLRVCTKQQNQMNKRPNSNTFSKFKGVSESRGNKKWTARIRKCGKQYCLGCFDDETEAAKTYDKKAKELFGEFARVNFP